MKKYFIACLFLFAVQYCVAQKKTGFLQLSSGVQIIDHAMSNYPPATAIPFTAKLGLGRGLQIGVEYSSFVVSPRFEYHDPASSQPVTETQDIQYYGAFIGINTSGGRRTGFVLQAGAGLNNITRHVISPTAESITRLKQAVQYKASTGLSFKVSKMIFLDLEVNGTLMQREAGEFSYDPSAFKPQQLLNIVSYGASIGIGFHF